MFARRRSARAHDHAGRRAACWIRRPPDDVCHMHDAVAPSRNMQFVIELSPASGRLTLWTKTPAADGESMTHRSTVHKKPFPSDKSRNVSAERLSGTSQSQRNVSYAASTLDGDTLIRNPDVVPGTPRTRKFSSCTWSAAVITIPSIVPVASVMTDRCTPAPSIVNPDDIDNGALIRYMPGSMRRRHPEDIAALSAAWKFAVSSAVPSPMQPNFFVVHRP
jgi:hypothetical protein